jgi:hypothetical protein
MTEAELRRIPGGVSDDVIRLNLNNPGFASGTSAINSAFEQQQRQQALRVRSLVEKVQKEIPKQARRGEWVEIGGKRHYMRSKWEQQYAAFLECLKQNGEIVDWEYEPKTFWFEGIRRGTNNYKPDFLVKLNNGREQYREVKGYLCRKSKTKLRRMKKYFPAVDVRLIDGTWFKANAAKLALIVPGWKRK